MSRCLRLSCGQTALLYALQKLQSVLAEREHLWESESPTARRAAACACSWRRRVVCDFRIVLYCEDERLTLMFDKFVPHATIRRVSNPSAPAAAN